MKKVSFFIVAALFAASSVFVGCSSDPSDPPTITIRFDGNNSSTGVFAPDDLYVGDQVGVELDFKAPGKIKEIRIAKASGTGENPPGTYPMTSGFNGETIHQVKWTVTGAAVGSVKYTADVTDKDKEAQSDTKIIEISFKERPPVWGDINTWADKTLGSLVHTSTAGSSCASIDGTVYSIADAKTNSAKIDFIYSDGATYPYMISAPDFSAIQSYPTGSPNAISSWTTKNATKLAKLSVTVTQFDACDNDELITTAVTDAAVTADHVDNLAANDVVGFITAGGKRGLIKVISTDRSSDANRSMKLSIKVQE